jgi:hypothetical protein
VVDRPSQDSERVRDARRRSRRKKTDDPAHDREDFWVLIADEDDETLGMLLGDCGEDATPLMYCRAVLDDDVLVIGEADPGRDHLLSELMQSDDVGQA